METPSREDDFLSRELALGTSGGMERKGFIRVPGTFLSPFSPSGGLDNGIWLHGGVSGRLGKRRACPNGWHPSPAYRTVAEKLQRGDPNPGFSLGGFPPALPFIGG